MRMQHPEENRRCQLANFLKNWLVICLSARRDPSLADRERDPQGQFFCDEINSAQLNAIFLPDAAYASGEF